MVKNWKRIIRFLFSAVFCTVIAVGMPQIVRAAEVAIDETNFPDANFRSYVRSQFDKNNNNGLSEEEIANVTEIILRNSNPTITNLKGVEYFTALTNLYCTNIKLTSLNLENNTALKKLHLEFTETTSLNLENNTALTDLYCCNNELTSLNLENNTALKSLWCSFNELTSLNLENNTALTDLNCQSNKLINLNLRNSTALDTLNCCFNKLTSLDLANNTVLRVLRCSSNELTSLNLENNTTLDVLDCTNNKLTSLDLGNNIALRELYCYKNKLTELKLNSQTYNKLSLGTYVLHSGGSSSNVKLSDLQNITAELKVIDITKPATYKVDGKDFTIIYSDTVVMPSESPSAEPSETPTTSPSAAPSAEPSETPSASPSAAPSASPTQAPVTSTSPVVTSDTHIFSDYNYTTPVTGSAIIYGNGINKKIDGKRVNNKALTVYTDILASYKHTPNSNGTVKSSIGKVIVAVTKTADKPTVSSRNKVTDTSASKIAKARIKNGQITVTAVGKEGGLVYLWVIDTGTKGVSACCPIDVKLAPKKLEVQSTTGTKLTNTKVQNGTTLDVHLSGVSSSVKTEDCTYTPTLDSKYQSYVQIDPKGNTGQDFTITAKGLKNSKDTKVTITFICDQNGKKVKFSLTITK